MSLIEFTSNVTDHSNDQGFQFEFHCDKCNSGHMTHFQASKIGIAGGFLRAAAGLFGSNALNQVAGAGDHLKDSMRGTARDTAFTAAVTEGKTYFKKCTRCGKWVCPETCWNAQRGLCEECAPDLQEEATAAQAAAAKQQVWEKAAATDQTGGMNLGQQQTGTCPHCGAKATPGKFCGECGQELHPKTTCPACHANLAPGAKFCNECGKKNA